MVLRLIAKVSSIFLLDRCLVNKWKTRGKGGFQKRAHYFKFKMRKIVKKVLFLASKNRPKSLICSLQSFLRNFASIFAKLISQNCFLHFAKFRETRHSISIWVSGFYSIKATFQIFDETSQHEASPNKKPDTRFILWRFCVAIDFWKAIYWPL